MKYVIVALLLLVTSGAYAEWEGFKFVNEDRHTCEYENVTRLVNEGDASCDHDWVYQPLDLSPKAVFLIHCACSCPDEGRNKICRKCLRKVNESTQGRMMNPKESEYSKLNRLIGDEK